MNKKQRLYLILSLFLMISGSACNNRSEKIEIRAEDLENYKSYNWQENFTIFPLTGNFSTASKAYSLKKGKYSIRFKAFGTPGENRLPRFILEFAGYRLKVVTVELRPSMYSVNFELPKDTNGKFMFTFNDDYNSPTEDRNVFIYFPVLVRKF